MPGETNLSKQDDIEFIRDSVEYYQISVRHQRLDMFNSLLFAKISAGVAIAGLALCAKGNEALGIPMMVAGGIMYPPSTSAGLRALNYAGEDHLKLEKYSRALANLEVTS